MFQGGAGVRYPNTVWSSAVLPLRVALVGAGQPVPDSSGAAAALVGQLSRTDLGARGVWIGPGGIIQR